MSDRYDEKLFLGFIEGDLSPAERLRFERQLAVDANLRLLVEQVQLDRQELRQIPAEPAPPEIMDAVNQALERSMLFAEPAAATSDHAARQQRLRLVRWSAYAAVAALAVVSTGLVFHTLMQGPMPPPAQPPLARLNQSVIHAGSPTIATIDTVALMLSNTGQAEVGSGGQYAVLVSDNEVNDARQVAPNTPALGAGPAPAPGPAGLGGGRGGSTVPGPAGGAAAPAGPMLAAKPSAPAEPVPQDGDAILNGRLEESKRGRDLASANDETRNPKNDGGDYSRAKLAAQAVGNTTLVSGGTVYGLSSNVSNQRIEVVAQNTLRTRNNLIVWCTNNGSTLVAESAATLGNQGGLAGNTLGNNGGNVYNNNFYGNGKGNGGSNSNSNDWPAQAAASNGLQYNAPGQALVGNALTNTVRLTVVVRPEKVAQLVRFMNANGDVARLTDQDANAAVEPTYAARADGMIVMRPAPAEAAPPASPAAAAPAGKLGKETEMAAGRVDNNAAMPQRLRNAPLPQNPEEQVAKDRRLANGPRPDPVQLKQAITRAQAPLANERQSGGTASGGGGGFEGTASGGRAQTVAVPVAGLARTNWALILQEQLPINSSLELPEAPANPATSLEVPVVITEDANQPAK